jgi:hypothetical protein
MIIWFSVPDPDPSVFVPPESVSRKEVRPHPSIKQKL